MTSPLTSDNTLYRSLEEIVGERNLFTEGEFYDACTHDAIQIVRVPLAAVCVESTEQIPALLRWAVLHSIPIVPRGAGTGLTGGAIAETGGVVLSLHKLKRIIELNVSARRIVVEPGVITQAIADAAVKAGLFYPPDPASLKESTIGGNVAESAGGLQCKKYGVTRDYVLGLEAYMADGSLLRTGCFSEDEVYDLTSVLIGSEGTLAIITKIALQLIAPPAHRRTWYLAFDSQTAAATVVAELLAAGVVPAVLEFMDGNAIACVYDYLGVKAMPPRAALILELDGSVAEVERDIAIVDPIVNRHAPSEIRVTADSEERDELWTLRRSLSPAVSAAAKMRVCEDICVPPSKFPDLVALVPEIGKKHELRTNSFGHAGDGNLHVYFMTDDDSDETMLRLDAAAHELCEAAIRFDGTISGEHGIGVTKRAYLPLELSPETLQLMRRVKSAFDAGCLLNPGKIFPS